MQGVVHNIDEAGEDRRLRMGTVAFAGTLALVVLLAVLEVRPAFRLVLFFPFLLSLNLAYQGLFKT